MRWGARAGMVGVCAAAACATAGAASAAPAMEAYSFPPGLLAGTGSAGATFTRFDALVAVPGGPGPHPVVLVAPGSYPQCVDPPRDRVVTAAVNSFRWTKACGTRRARTDTGLTDGPSYVRWPASFATLANALAARGMAAVVMDTAAKDMLWWGEPDADDATRRLALAHLDMLRGLDAGRARGLPWATTLTGRLDLGRIAVVSHSSGAGYVFDRLNRGDMPELVAAVALEPVLRSVRDDRAMPHPIPVMVVSGRCDEQAAPAGVDTLVRRFAAANPTAPVAYARMSSTTHIGMVGGGGDHRVGLVAPVETPACAPSRLAPPRAIQRVTARLVADYLAQRFAGDDAVTVPTTRGLRVQAERRAGAMPVATRTVRSLPPWIVPRSVRVTTSTERVLPPLPAGTRLSVGPGDDAFAMSRG